MPPPLGRRSCGWRAARGSARLVAAIRPDVVIERYHNFGGEGILAARGASARWPCSR